MRQKTREICDRQIMSAMMDQIEILHLAIHDTPFPYIVPLNFGYEWQDNELVFFFHSAKAGMKLDLLRRDSHVCVNAASFISYADGPYHGHLHDYRSVTAYGMAEEIDPEQRKAYFLHAHECLLKHNRREMQPGDEAAMKFISMWEIRCPAETVWGKAEIVPRTVKEVPFYTGPGDGMPLSEQHIIGKESNDQTVSGPHPEQ